MKSLKSLLSVAALVVAGFTANAQTADDIVNKHLDAAGGKDKLASITSIVTEVTVSSQMGESTAKSTVLVGKGSKTEMDMGGQQMVQAITDKGGWAINPMQGGGAQAMPDEQYKGMATTLYVDPFLDYAAHGNKVELQGTEGDDYKVLLTTQDNAATTYYINKNTYLIDKLVRSVNMMGQDMDVTMTFSDYKKNDFGITSANTIETAYGTMFSMTMKTKTVTYNTQIDPAIFEMPK